MAEQSYWNKTAIKKSYPRLEKNLEVDTLIIGGGITGVTCAYCLTQKGVAAALIEAGGLCDGTTGNTTGKVTTQHDIIYSNLINKYGTDFAKNYYLSQNDSLAFVRKAVEKEAIDCQLIACPSYLYAAEEKELEAIEKEFEAAEKIGIDAEFIGRGGFPNENFGMLAFQNQNAFHAVRYVEALAFAAVKKGIQLYCNTKAVKVENGDIVTVICENDLVIKAKHVVMATQYPIFDGLNLYYTRLYADRSYGIAVEAERDWPEGNYINTGKPTRSIRTHIEKEKRILIPVGESHFTARSEVNTEQHYENLIRFADQLAGVKSVLAKWSAQDYKSPDQVPYIGRNSDNSNVYVAAGYGKWGLSNGTLAGRMIADLITKGSCDYEEIYSRKRSDITSSFGTILSEVSGSVGELLNSKLKSTESIKDLKQGESRVINFEKQKAGIYRDFDDTVIILDINCTHMKTTLVWNEAEKTWDCPAHGGRFAVDGTLLEGPPKHNLKVLFQGKMRDLVVED